MFWVQKQVLGISEGGKVERDDEKIRAYQTVLCTLMAEWNSGRGWPSGQDGPEGHLRGGWEAPRRMTAGTAL